LPASSWRAGYNAARLRPIELQDIVRDGMTRDDPRPDPDALLRRLGAEEHRRGRLKIFFGSSAGVGKTYAMLDAAQNKRREGADVMIGWVETHDRAETAALAEALGQIPARELEYRGTRVREFDLDAALARRPNLLLLDELAHTNAPGSRHTKRWQDAQELLDAGIDVYTTLNVQHLESLNDLVARITGVPVRETVPDHVLDTADEIAFVDLPPEDLLRRLAEGKVYLADQAAHAARNFFRKGNLIALRELALRRTAERVDAEMQDYRRDHEIRETWPVAERVLVCVRPNPDSEQLVRAARRMAARLRAEWIVVSVESPAQPVLSDQERHALAATLKLAEQLGAQTAVISGEHVATALIAFARERNVSKILVGKPAHSRWYDRVRGSLLDDLVRRSGEIDVYIISGEPSADGGARQLPRLRARSPARDYVLALAVVCVNSLLCWVMLAGHFEPANLIMLYLLGIAFVAVRFGRGPSLLAACASVASFDFFFVQPYLTFAVSDTQYIVTFGVMLAVSLLISTLATRVRDQAAAARQREGRTQVLYAVSRELAGLRAPEEIARAASRHVSDMLRGSAAVLLAGSDGRLPADTGGVASEQREQAVAQWVLDNGRMAGLGTDTLPGASALYLPVSGAPGVLAVLAVRPSEELLPLSPDHFDLLETVARLIAAPLERARLAAEIERTRLAAEAEQMRSALLSSVSHDLRTPLAAITGAASSLLQNGSRDDGARQELIATIYEESERLNRLVANLLDMTRVEAGGLRLNREWHPLEEVVGSALARLDRLLAGRRIETVLAADLPLVSIDAVLVESVLVNLLENAAKYTPPGSPLRIAATVETGAVRVEIADEGPGLPPDAEQRVFEKFYRGPSGRHGFGLGLAICRAIVAAHGGRIWAQNRTPRGTTFSFTLPVEGAPPLAPEEAREREGP
jgi:two-component system sensor histidine kinase KdpD